MSKLIFKFNVKFLLVQGRDVGGQMSLRATGFETTDMNKIR